LSSDMSPCMIPSLQLNGLHAEVPFRHASPSGIPEGRDDYGCMITSYLAPTDSLFSRRPVALLVFCRVCPTFFSEDYDSVGPFANPSATLRH